MSFGSCMKWLFSRSLSISTSYQDTSWYHTISQPVAYISANWTGFQMWNSVQLILHLVKSGIKFLNKCSQFLFWSPKKQNCKIFKNWKMWEWSLWMTYYKALRYFSMKHIHFKTTYLVYDLCRVFNIPFIYGIYDSFGRFYGTLS